MRSLPEVLLAKATLKEKVVFCVRPGGSKRAVLTGTFFSNFQPKKIIFNFSLYILVFRKMKLEKKKKNSRLPGFFSHPAHRKLFFT